MREVGTAVLKTLIYSDTFDYPLSKDQLWKYLIGEKLEREFFEDFLKKLPKEVGFRDGFYYLSGREKIIQTRLKRKRASKEKIILAKKIIEQLCCIPTIKFVGISGALSLENSGRDDDIDLFVITSKGKLWLTRLVLVILLLFIGRYRRRNQKKISDKICLNMIIDESALSFQRGRRDLYTAHEIAQVMPILERDGMYQKFISSNRWAEKFLPNSLDTKILSYKDIKKKKEKVLSILISQYLNICFKPLEWLAKTVQLWSIKRHITTETIKSGFLAFHPLDYKEKVLGEYKKRLKSYELL